MEQVGADAPREARDVLLLAADPLESVAGADRHDELLAPERLACGLAVDERDEVKAGSTGEGRDQLAGVRLHAARLAWDKKDEVERDLHDNQRRRERCRSSASTSQS